MNRNEILILAIVGAVLVAALLVPALREKDTATLQIRAVSSKFDPANASGTQTITFVVTNGDLSLFPWFATVTTPDGEAPYYAIETRTRNGWERTRNPTNYSFTHYLLPNHSWEFQISLEKPEQPTRIVLFYTVGHRPSRRWLDRQASKLLQGLGLVKVIRELRSEVLKFDQANAANERSSMGLTAAPSCRIPRRSWRSHHFQIGRWLRVRGKFGMLSLKRFARSPERSSDSVEGTATVRLGLYGDGLRTVVVPVPTALTAAVSVAAFFIFGPVSRAAKGVPWFSGVLMRLSATRFTWDSSSLSLG